MGNFCFVTCQSLLYNFTSLPPSCLATFGTNQTAIGKFNGFVQFRLVNVVVRVMGDVFPELKQNEIRIRDIIADEEASFGKTLLKVSVDNIGFVGPLIVNIT
jgi:hypothetical protein